MVPSIAKGSYKRHLSNQQKCYFTIKLITKDKDGVLVKYRPPTAKAGNLAGFEKTLYQRMGNKPPERYIIWVKDVIDKVVTDAAKPDWDLV